MSAESLAWHSRAKRVVVAASGKLGAHHFARVLTGTVPRILMFHRFSRRAAWRSTSIDNLAAQLACLKKGYRIVTMDAMIDSLKSGIGSKPSEVVVTVDDAYADFYEVALPVFERFRVPVTLYVPTDFVDGRGWLWPDRLLYLLRATEQEAVEFEALGSLPLISLSQRRSAWSCIADSLLAMDEVARHRAFCLLETRLSVATPQHPTDEYRPMTWEQVRDASRRGVLIGSQATAHVPMARESPARQYQLASESKARLESELGSVVRHFSYPHGRVADFDAVSVSAARESAYESSVAAVTTVADGLPGMFALPRLSAPGVAEELEGRLSGLKQLREWAGV